MNKKVGVGILLSVLMLGLVFSIISVSAALGAPCQSQDDCGAGEACRVSSPGASGVCVVSPAAQQTTTDMTGVICKSNSDCLDGRVCNSGGFCVVAQQTTTGSPSAVEGSFEPTGFSAFANFGNLSARWALWKVGYENVKGEQMGLLTETLKFIVLFIIIFVVFSALGAMEFPKSPTLRFILSVLVGILATFMITTEEMLTALTSYGALATTIIIAVPLIVLLGMTVMAAYKANAIGLYASRVLWAVFAIFLIVKGLVLLSMFQYFTVSVSTNADGNSVFTAHSVIGADGQPVKIPSYLRPIIPVKFNDGSNVPIADMTKIAQIMGKADYGSAWLLLLVGGILMIFMVFNSKWIYAWLEKEARDSAIEAAKQNINLSTARDKLQAEAMRETAKT